MASGAGPDLAALSADQQEALSQYMAVTNQDVGDAVPLLERSQWNVQIAISKFFDGEGPDPVAEAMAAQAAAPNVHTENLQDSFDMPPPTRRPQTETAPRVVPQRAGHIPFFFSVLLYPFNFGYKMVSFLYRTVLFVASFLPASIRPRAVTDSLAAGIRSVSGRRMLLPRDTAARFKREFEEEYGQELPFFEGGAAQALDAAKNDLKFLLMVLISPEHDDTDSFVRETLLSPEVVELVKNPANNILLWGGNVLDSEAYQVSLEYNCTKFPFTVLVCLTPKEGSTRMGIIKRMAGPMPASRYLRELSLGIEKYTADLASVRSERRAREAARSIREEQDSAYERSLARDRERARQRREAERQKAEAEQQAALEAQKAAEQKIKRDLWRRWRAGTIAPEPESSNTDIVRLAIKMPEESGAGRIVRRFKASATLDDLYAFVECFDLLGSTAHGDWSALDDPENPQDYTHKYEFQIASTMPRVVYEASEEKTLGEAIGRSASLVVESCD
ncbi:UBX domain-containing protein 10 [Ceratocystis lukuohia]|uniref:UBX domain-containing protein 10 n=3 Tax=Ceratocystis TaxID=5157 RepID=A0A0F8DIA7_CERFI|nr:UBX domain-containing protein 10 [Ceratocystis platani]PHH51111.1 UBX domain-containing protein 10 [Ceratocystis fimbriata CBS 114723]